MDVSVLGFGDNVVDVYEHTHMMYPGGNAANFAAIAKRLGVKRSAYMGYFGSDAAGEHVISSLKSEGVELIKCKQLLGPNGAAHVTVVNGDRVFVGSNAGGIRGETSFVLDRFDIDYIKQFDVVHTGNYCFTERQLHKIQEVGVPISFDFSDDSTDDYISKIAPLVSFAFMSAGSLSMKATKDKLRQLVSLGPQYANATRGADGAVGFDGQTFYYQQSNTVKNLVDTMAAGDAFLTGFIVGWFSLAKQLVSKQERIKYALRLAADAAAHTCEIDGSWGYAAPFKSNE
jgi:sugar/nucleoside kinase (ribokinase family)